MDNSFFDERYMLAVERIAAMKDEHPESEFCGYFNVLSELVVRLDGVRNPVMTGDFYLMDDKVKSTLNRILYYDILPENYDYSYANPDFAVKELGKCGKLLSALYYMLILEIPKAFTGCKWELTVLFELIIEVYGIVFDEESDKSAAIRRAIYYFRHDYCHDFSNLRQKRMRTPEGNELIRIFKKGSEENRLFLYDFGEYVSPELLETYEYLETLSEEKIDSIATTFVDGYVRGFEVQGIDFSDRKIVEIRYPMGFERIVASAISKFEKLGKSVLLYHYRSSPNKQCDYDHRNDHVLWLDERYKNVSIDALECACKEYKDSMAVYAGPACLEAFGERQFRPVNKDSVITPDEKERKLMTEMQTGQSEVITRYIDMTKRSFTIMALPVPEIGKDFEEIFEEVIKVNTLDNEKYLKIQQKMIDILDEGEYVRVKGSGNNKTDIKVRLHRLENPSSETNFENCTADVNIPLGEVFTSPVLTGTEGVLHVSKAYLNEFEFKQLRLEFKDGMISSYSCENFGTEEENKKYIREKILHNHDSLPIGEFAIGTNTTAYAMANRFGIWDRLPILIAEKTGPHFAVGDTCYSDMEDFMTYNPDGKAIIARDNEVSILRKEDRSKAYFNCHTDITIPYDELEYIRVVGADGSEESIIENGRFVFEGAGELNKALG